MFVFVLNLRAFFLLAFSFGHRFSGSIVLFYADMANGCRYTAQTIYPIGLFGKFNYMSDFFPSDFLVWLLLLFIFCIPIFHSK